MNPLRTYTVAFVVLTLTAAVPAVAADPRGLFSVKGVGTASCQQYLDAAKAQGKEFLLFAGYLGGYVTAYNQLAYDTFDILPWQDAETLLAMLNGYCGKHPETNFAAAVGLLTKVLQPERLTVAAEIVEVPGAKKPMRIYKETLNRIQRRLAELGHYAGAVTGELDKATREALQKFQKDRKLPETGLPDQQTLFTLLATTKASE
jgi:Putative peptidoglycan binding domain